MRLDLREVPFSRGGAYMTFSRLAAAGASPEGLYMCCVHGGALEATPGGRMARVEVTYDGVVLPVRASITPARLDLISERGTLSICISEPYVVRVRGAGVGARLTFDPAHGDYAAPASEGRCRINTPAAGVSWMLTPLSGDLRVDMQPVVFDLMPGDNGMVCEAALDEFTSGWRPRLYEETFDEAVDGVAGEFRQWLEQSPTLPAEYSDARQMAGYINWSAMVEPAGHLLRPAMLLSKQTQAVVGGWEHCFTAMALVYRKQIAAWDQLMTLFDQQDELGALPDSVSDRVMEWNFCKPPIHGWVLGWMMQRTSFIRTDQVRQIYGPMCRWTEWWLRYRDDDRDGLPQYHHGRDSGWEDATPFLAGAPLESPDLCAYLVLQMEALASMAQQLNSAEESESWQRRADELLEKMVAHFWQGDHFVAMRSGDHDVSDDESLFLHLPILLGRRLPAGLWREMITGLTRPGRFLTPHGFATESPSSPLYAPSSGWRGPLWAVSTLLMVEGLASCGEMEFARELARRYCDLVAKRGFAARFDPSTGDPLGDRASTVAASIFLILGHEYLEEIRE